MSGMNCTLPDREFDNCTLSDRESAFLKVIIWEQLTICFIGSTCNAVNIWCLFRCQKIERAVKIQLICLFSLQMAICIINLPFAAFLAWCKLFCWLDKMPMQVQLAFSILNSILPQAERLNFTVIGVYRVAAICCPHQYKKMVSTGIVVSCQVGIFLAMVPPLIAFSVLEESDFPINDGTILSYFVNEGVFMMTVYGVYFCIPFVITFVAYAIMMVSTIRRKRLIRKTNQRSSSMDHVVFTISMIFTTYLLLDGPHVIVHLMDEGVEGYFVIHMVFILRLALDPIIFVGMNRYYRKDIIDKIRHCMSSFPCCSDQPFYPSKDSGEVLKEDDKATRSSEC